MILRQWVIKYGQKYGARWALGLLITLLAAIQIGSGLHTGVIERADTFIYGLRMRMEKPVLDKRIVIIDIDEKSLNEVGRFPWSRNVVAQLITKMTGYYQASAVGFDIMFTEEDNSSGYKTLAELGQNDLKNIPEFSQKLESLKARLDYDGLMAEAMRGQPVVLGYFLSDQQHKGMLPAPAFTEEDLNGRSLPAPELKGHEANLARLQQAARSGGFFNADLDADGILRSSPLLAKVGDGYYPSLSLATAAVAKQATAIKPLFQKTIDKMSESERRAGGLDAIAIFAPGKNTRIPIGEKLATAIQYRGVGGPKGGAFRYISASDVLQQRIPQEELKGTIMLVGTTAAGLNDLRATPVSSEYPGVEVHANVIRSILDDQFKHRPDYAVGAEITLVLVLGIALCFILPVLSPLPSISLASASAVAVVAGNFWLYHRHDAVLNLANPLLLIGSLFVLDVVWGYFFEFRNRQAIVQLFGEYVAPELVAEMADHPQDYNMEGESRELTVLFVDVRGFTTISEGLTPKALREYINIYLTAMSADIRNNRGTLDKYIGDAVMAFWGAPIALPDHASRAVGSALKMLETAEQLNKDFISRGWPPLKIGIGLNTGQMHVGDMGSNVRRAYTVMGDAVNLGSRLEGITKQYGVGLVVGESTKQAAPEYFYRQLDCVRVKGKNEPIPIFEPIAAASTVSPQLRMEVERWHMAYGLVMQQRWDHAEDVLRELLKRDPDNYLYKLYQKRIAYYRLHPPGEDWDGVTTFETK
ncbi:MAG: adenylate/guanylate cyclase domain-containing protein [Burkholderiales bacterium]|nr:adenylate/guanylate cyclase domain-containing protein [Burkholderiales bacterium]